MKDTLLPYCIKIVKNIRHEMSRLEKYILTETIVFHMYFIGIGAIEYFCGGFAECARIFIILVQYGRSVSFICKKN